MGSGGRRGGFNLVELIVVISLAALLMAILMSMIRVARDGALRVRCESNLRQIGYAFHLYANANHNWLPNWSGWHSTAFPEDPAEEPSWCGKVAEWLPPDSPVYQCPAFPQEPMKLHNYFIEAAWSYVNGLHSTKLSDVRLCSQFLLAGDITQLSVYPKPAGTLAGQSDDYDRDDANIPNLLFPADGGFLMHPGGNNVLFSDLHVETCSEFDPAAITFHPKRMESWADVEAGGPD